MSAAPNEACGHVVNVDIGGAVRREVVYYENDVHPSDGGYILVEWSEGFPPSPISAVFAPSTDCQDDINNANLRDVARCLCGRKRVQTYIAYDNRRRIMLHKRPNGTSCEYSRWLLDNINSALRIAGNDEAREIVDSEEFDIADFERLYQKLSVRDDFDDILNRMASERAAIKARPCFGCGAAESRCVCSSVGDER